MVVVAGEAGMVGEVFGGIDAGERAEVVDKVRLIEIAAIDSDIGPPNGPTRRDAAEHALETANAAFSAGNPLRNGTAPAGRKEMPTTWFCSPVSMAKDLVRGPERAQPSMVNILRVSSGS